MEFETSKWVKPFATGITCLDTIDGECRRGLSKDECKQVCEDSFRCDYGYHVEVPNTSKSYCVPLNNLTHWDNPAIFEMSMMKPSESSILHPSLGVKVTPFVRKIPDTVYQKSIYDVTQLGIHVLQYIDPSSSRSNVLYLYDDMTFGPEVDKAVQVVLFKDDPVPSSVSTKDPTIRSGNVIFIKNHNSNRVVLHITPTDFGFMPYSLRVSSSTTYDVNALFHTQILKGYPFTYDAIRLDDRFAIRVAQIPVRESIYYWDVDTTTMRLRLVEVPREQMASSDPQRFVNFQLDRLGEVDVSQAENFALAQQNYLYNNYVSNRGEDMYSDEPSNMLGSIAQRWVPLVLMLVLLILLLGYVYYHYRSRSPRRRRRPQPRSSSRE